LDGVVQLAVRVIAVIAALPLHLITRSCTIWYRARREVMRKMGPEWMDADNELDDFLVESQADECAVHQPANKINDSIPF